LNNPQPQPQTSEAPRNNWQPPWPFGVLRPVGTATATPTPTQSPTPTFVATATQTPSAYNPSVQGPRGIWR